MMNRAITIVLMLLAPAFVMAQGNGCHTSGSFTMCTHYAIGDANGGPNLVTGEADNTPNAKIMNVWHHVTGMPSAFVQMASGHDSAGNLRHLAVTSTGTIYEYLDYWSATTPNSWASRDGYGAVTKKLVLGDNIYSLQANSGCPNELGQPMYQVFKWTSSGTWAATGFGGGSTGCVFDFAASDANDGGWVIYTYYCPGNADQNCIQWQNSSGHLYGAWAGTGWHHVAMLNATTAAASSQSPYPYVYMLNLSANTDTQLGSLNSNGGKLAWGPDLLLALDSTGNVERWNGTAWDQLVGAGFTDVSSCGTTCTFALDGSGSVWRYPDFSMTVQAYVTGNTTCTPNCPQGTTHTGQITVKFNKSLTGGQTSTGQPVAPTAQISVNAEDSTYDPYDCFDPGSPFSCLTTTSGGNIACSAVGTIFANPILGSAPPPQSGWKTAYTRVDNGSNQSCFQSSFLQCAFASGCTYNGGFDYYCDQGLNPNPGPDYEFGAVSACVTNGEIPPGPNPDLWGFDTSGYCYYAGPGLSPTVCIHDPFPGTFGRNGPLTKTPLFNSLIKKDTKGTCTITGVTQ